MRTRPLSILRDRERSQAKKDGDSSPRILFHQYYPGLGVWGFLICFVLFYFYRKRKDIRRESCENNFRLLALHVWIIYLKLSELQLHPQRWENSYSLQVFWVASSLHSPNFRPPGHATPQKPSTHPFTTVSMAKWLSLSSPVFQSQIHKGEKCLAQLIFSHEATDLGGIIPKSCILPSHSQLQLMWEDTRSCCWFSNSRENFNRREGGRGSQWSTVLG